MSRDTVVSSNMKTRILLLATLIAIGLTSCSSKDDEPKQEDSIENNLSNDAKMFVGYWNNQGNKGYNFIFFEDGICWAQKRNESLGHVNQGYWTYDSTTKILATNVDSWQWQVTLSNSETWAGVSLGLGTVQTFDIVKDRLSYLLNLIQYSKWNNSSNVLQIFDNYDGYYSTFRVDSDLDYDETTDISFADDENTDDYIFSYQLVKLEYYSYRYGSGYKISKTIGKGNVELLNPTNLSKNALRFTGYLNVTLKRNLNDD